MGQDRVSAGQNDEDAPLFGAADLLAARSGAGGRPPTTPFSSAVLALQASVVAHARKRHGAKEVRGFFGNVYRLRNGAGLATGFGIGAPAMAVMAEDLIAQGARRLVAIGVAGGLDAALRPGDIVVCERAISDEGTSRHYVADSRTIEADAGVGAGLRGALAEAGLAPRSGATWTMDAPYRERRSLVARRRGEGAVTVEMEAAALFAVGQALAVPAGAAFVVADTLGDGRWRWDNDPKRTAERLAALLDAVVGWLSR